MATGAIPEPSRPTTASRRPRPCAGTAASSASSASGWRCGSPSSSRRRPYSPISTSIAPSRRRRRNSASSRWRLTFVVITGEIDLSFPSIMALGTAAFCLDHRLWRRALVDRPRLRAGDRRGCGLLNGLLVAKLNIPSLVITIGTSFLYRGLELVLMNGTGVPLTADKYPAMHALLRASVFGVPVQTHVDDRHPHRRSGSCSTAPGSAPMCSWSATIRPARG